MQIASRNSIATSPILSSPPVPFSNKKLHHQSNSICSPSAVLEKIRLLLTAAEPPETKILQALNLISATADGALEEQSELFVTLSDEDYCESVEAVSDAEIMSMSGD